MRTFIIFLIRIYKKTEPTRTTIAQNLHMTVGECRFNPTCSEYTSQMVEKYGVLKGLRLGFKQFAQCHPFAR